MAFVVFYVVTW